jgi:protein-arginine kinase activator protein McsA
MSKNNERLLSEDLSFSNLQEDISVETEAVSQPLPIPCDWLDSRKNKECEFKSKDREILMNHISSHLRPNPTETVQVENMISCEKCDFDTYSESELKKHNEDNIHSNIMAQDELEKSVCDEVVDNHTKLIVDDEILDTSDVQVVKEILQDVIQIDQTKMPDLNIVICGECAKSFGDEITANAHLETHGTNKSTKSFNVNTFKCDQCDHMYLKNDELREHKITVHKMYGCIYVCNGCDYKTSHITTFWAHKLKEHGDGPIMEKNMSDGNLFLNILASQQENMNDDINKLKAENKLR